MRPQRELALVPNADELDGLRRPAETWPVVAPEAALVRRALGGDVDAFADLYNTHRSAILATCLKRLRDRETAEDVVQDTFLRAYASLSSYDERRPLGAWLNSIAVHRCIDLLRQSSRTEVSDEVEDHLPRDVDSDPTLGAVIALEERGRLRRALRQLHPRQRRALLLYALEGWSCADVAAAEGISVGAAKSLLFHARANLRRTCRRGVLGTIVAALVGMRRRATRGAMTIRSRMTAGLEPLNLSVAPVSTSIAAVVLSFAAAAPGVAAVPIIPAAAQSAVSDPGSGSVTRSFASAIAPRIQERGLADGLLHPTRGATPEKTQITSVAASPNYEQDRTLFAAGRVPCQQSSCMVLFVSHDGGTTWARQGSEDFNGHTVLLPPSYPSDPRIFAMGDSGLEVSADGGDTFKVVAPLQGDVAISPLFNAQDPRILIGASVVTEYWANRQLAKPATLVGPAGTWLTIAFSPAYAQDNTIFVGGIRPDTTGTMRPTVNRCAGSMCDNVVFTEGFDAPWLRPSPAFARDKTVYAFTSHVLFRSIDGGTTYRSRSPSFAVDGSFRDLIATRDGTLLAAIQHRSKGRTGIYRSDDGGTTWSSGRLQLPGFEGGASRLIALSDGRLLALGTNYGIACSSNGGRTWAPRCAA